MQYAFLVVTCTEYSDLWLPCFSLLSKFKPKGSKVYVATDVFPPNAGNYPNFTFVEAGKGTLNTTRMLKALKEVDEDYIIFMLDDYFISKEIDETELFILFDYMAKHSIDYVSFDRGRDEKKFFPLEGTPLEKITSNDFYSICTRLAIWKKEAMEKSFVKEENPWEAEVRLAGRFNKNGLKGAYSKSQIIQYIHGVSKGKFFRHSFRFLRKKNLYSGNRKQMNIFAQMKANLVGFFILHSPNWLFQMARKVKNNRGLSLSNQYKEGDS